MPSRIIYDSIRSSESLDAVSADAERLFWRLVVTVDDYGRTDGRTSVVRSNCFQLRGADSTLDAKVEEWLAELVATDMVRQYTVKGRNYLELLTFRARQRVRATHSKWPEPDPPSSADIRGQMPADVRHPRTSAGIRGHLHALSENGNVNENGNENGRGERGEQSRFKTPAAAERAAPRLASRPSRRASRAAPLPDDFTLTEPRKRFAADGGLEDIALLFGEFKDHHLAVGSVRKDWEAAWRSWCRKEHKFDKRLAAQRAARGHEGRATR